jgi:hypothetical protein
MTGQPTDPRTDHVAQLRAELVVIASYCIRRYGDGEDDTEFAAGKFINKLLPWIEERERRLRAEIADHIEAFWGNSMIAADVRSVPSVREHPEGAQQ